ncbi:nuclear transport factor 2 family protein [Sphingomonas sp.]|uniref:nuclear transport factor 2 family protein n=1 Tax=Sphingomonas sp. TaxID=28214 RepID=UPI003CC5C194
MLPLLLALAQVTPVQPMPHGTGLPPATAEAQGDAPAILAAVNGLFAALTARDMTRAQSFFRADGGAQAVVEQPDGTRTFRHETWPQFLARLPATGPRFVEALTDPAVEVDGDIAMVWSPYTVMVDERLVHCGVDHFDLIREGGQWKILNISWTQRTAGCAAQ